MKVALSSRSLNNIVSAPQISFSGKLSPSTYSGVTHTFGTVSVEKMRRSRPTEDFFSEKNMNFLQSEIFSNPFYKLLKPQPRSGLAEVGH